MRYLALSVILILLFTNQVFASPLEDSLQEQLEKLDLKELLNFTELLEESYQEYLPEFSLQTLLQGDVLHLEPGEFLIFLTRRFLKELSQSFFFLRQLIALGVLIGLLERLTASLELKAVANFSLLVCFLILLFLALEGFQILLNLASGTVNQLVNFLYALIPILISLLIAVGGVVSASIFHPLLWGFLTFLASVVQNFLFPLILTSTIFALLAQLSEELPFGKLADFLKKTVQTALGAIFLTFSGLMFLKGFLAPITDGLSLKTAKYLTRNLIPVAGGMFADVLELALGGTLLIKNGVGVFGLIFVLFYVLNPLVKIWVMVLIYKFVGAVLEPICGARFSTTLRTMETSLTLLFTALGTVALVFILSISILVALGNLTLFLR